MVHALAPSQDAGQRMQYRGFSIRTRKFPILKAGPIEDMTARLGIAPPEMIFGDNLVAIEHEPSGWGISFSAFDALDRVDKTGTSRLKVAYSREWQKNREKVHEGIKEVVKPFDWSYTTDYTGTVRSGGSSTSTSNASNGSSNTNGSTNPNGSSARQFEPCDGAIPMPLLQRPDPILFYDSLILYEDELADNGVSMLSCKIRVMPARMLLLQRFFLRLDDVVVRIRDTRVYIDFDSLEVMREYVAREEDFASVKAKVARSGEDVTAIMRDPNALSEILAVQQRRLEHLFLS